MNLPLRLTLTAVIATLILAGLSAADRTGAADLDFWNVPTLKAEIADECRVAVELQAHSGQVLRRIAEKEAVVADLSEGRISLMAAAARFRALNSHWTFNAAIFRAMYPDMSDDERVYRNVIAFAESTNAFGEALGLQLRVELFVLKAAGRLSIADPTPDADGD